MKKIAAALAITLLSALGASSAMATTSVTSGLSFSAPTMTQKATPAMEARKGASKKHKKSGKSRARK